jgi:ketosteroid isomerase-like protein
MKFPMGRLASVLIATILGAGAATAVPADAPKGRDVTAELEAVIRKGEAIGARGGSAEEIADAFYEDDLTFTGEGEKGMYPNLKSFMKPLYDYTRNPTCRMKIVDRVRHSGNIAVAWVAEHCEASGKDPAADYRVIYVFRNGKKGWRVTMEMFTTGKF